MLLIVTHTEDYTVDYVANILNKKALPFFRLNTDLLHMLRYEVTANPDFTITLDGHSQFSGLWFRRVKLPALEVSEVGNFIALDYESLLFNLISAIDFNNIISLPYNVYRAENKLIQLQEALRIGFQVPKTLLTSHMQSLTTFVSSKESIIKPIRCGRLFQQEKNFLIYTNRITTKQLDDNISLTPAIYQEEITKLYEVRVTVVGTSVFSAKVFSQAEPETSLDWRKKHLRFEPHTLPSDVSDRCVQLVRKLGLSFGAIDLIFSKDEQYYFLEINPNGQWVWIELDTGLSIAESIINFLFNDKKDFL